jgi:hypothetical protein
VTIIWDIGPQEEIDNEHGIEVEYYPLGKSRDDECRIVLDVGGLPSNFRAEIYISAQEARAIAIQLIEAAYQADAEDRTRCPLVEDSNF